jgi:hypothetical protein
MALTKDFGFGPDEQLVRDQARRFLRDNFPVDRLRKLVAADHHEAYESAVQPAPYDRDLWRQMVELGWIALAVPEAAGGVGMKMIAVAALAEEIGRVALPSPLMATLVATLVLREAGATSWLARVVAGETAALAATGVDGSWEAGETSVTAKPGDGVVPDGTAASWTRARRRSLVVSAAGPKSASCRACGRSGVASRPIIVDPTRDQATVRLNASPSTPPASSHDPHWYGDPRAATRHPPSSPGLLRRGRVAAPDDHRLCAHARQFEHPIGFFQPSSIDRQT